MNNLASRQGLSHRISRGVAWATMPIFVTACGIFLWLEYGLGLSSLLRDVMLMIGFGAFALVGSLLIARRPGNSVGWIMILIGLMAGLFASAEMYAAYVMTTRGSPNPVAVFGAWANNIYLGFPLMTLAFVYLPLLFPDGHLPSRRWLPVAVIPGVAAAGMAMLGAFTETLVGQNVAYQIKNPIGIPGLSSVEDQLFAVLLPVLLIGILGGVAAVIVRFRRADPVQRQQLKWFLFAATFLAVLPLADYLPPFIEDIPFLLALVGLPTAIGVAILRYRLYDIDIIIRKTLVYGALTATLGLVFFGGVALLQRVVGGLTGTDGSPVAIVITTLLIAALVAPLRRRIQEFIDRRFYRRKYDAEQALEAFAATARSETDLEALTGKLVEVVSQTMQPELVNVWLTKPGRRS